MSKVYDNVAKWICFMKKMAVILALLFFKDYTLDTTYFCFVTTYKH